MTLICECFDQDTTLHTLASFPSAIYTFATPFLYRTLIIDPLQACNLFGLLHDISPADRRLRELPVPPYQHHMDFHPAHRFRIVLPHVEEIALEVCADRVGLGEGQYTRLRWSRSTVEGLGHLVTQVFGLLSNDLDSISTYLDPYAETQAASIMITSKVGAGWMTSTQSSKLCSLKCIRII